jgi:hypothetical protein
MLRSIEAKQTAPIAVDDGAGGQHLRVEQRMPTNVTVKHPAMPVCPIHHGRDREKKIV